MTNSNLSLETLKSENFTLQSRLTAKNRRILEKMFRYIRTFPLDEYHVELIHQDLIGMAKEAELRQESFPGTLGKAPLSFCDDLLLASGQISLPAGRSLLRISSLYYRFIGTFFAIIGLSNIIGQILGFLVGGEIWILKIMSGDKIVLFLYQLFVLAVGILYQLGGDRAKRYSSNSSKSNCCLKWGFFLLLLQIVTVLLNYILQVLNLVTTISSVVPSIGIILQIITIIEFIFPLLYILGAWKNKEKIN